MTGRPADAIGRTLAVVGAGPAGMYAARAAAASGRFSAVDVIEALPAPYGLVRYGVAPDHPETKRVAKVFDRAFDLGQVRFLGNVVVGRDVTHATLARHYDAVLYATGVSGGRMLPIPGAALPGSLSSAQFVSWYSGHPEAAPCSSLTGVTRVVVVGGGNVALDVARLLVSPHDALRETDLPDDVLAALETSAVREVEVLVRKGPGETRYSPVVLRELDELSDVSLFVDKQHIRVPDDATDLARATRDNLEIFRTWSEAANTPSARSIRFRFWTEPTQITGGNRVEKVCAVAAQPGSPERELSIRADLIVHCVGFGAEDPEWLPAGAQPGVAANLDGRVQYPNGDYARGLYVAGWLKRGPSGTIATNRADAEETVSRIIEDLDSLPSRADRSDLCDRLTTQGVTVTSWTGWRAIQKDERVAGQRRGAETVKLSDRQRLIASACGADLEL